MRFQLAVDSAWRQYSLLVRALLLLPALSALLVAGRPLVVISVDGLDNRYLANADQMRLKGSDFLSKIIEVVVGFGADAKIR